MKEVYEFIQEELNKNDYFKLVQSDIDRNIVYLVWKDEEERTFAKVYIDQVIKAMEMLKKEGEK